MARLDWRRAAPNKPTVSIDDEHHRDALDRKARQAWRHWSRSLKPRDQRFFSR